MPLSKGSRNRTTSITVSRRTVSPCTEIPCAEIPCAEMVLPSDETVGEESRLEAFVASWLADEALIAGAIFLAALTAAGMRVGSGVVCRSGGESDGLHSLWDPCVARCVDVVEVARIGAGTLRCDWATDGERVGFRVDFSAEILRNSGAWRATSSIDHCWILECVRRTSHRRVM